VLLLYLFKNDGFEDIDLGAFPPSVGGEAGFEAGFGQEFLPVPVVLDRDLGEQQAAPASLSDDEPVLSDLDEIGIFDLLQGSQDRDLVFEGLKLGGRDRSEAGIFGRRIDGALNDGPVKGIEGLDEADAAAQLAFLFQRDKGAFGG
jgi:hypothetical protein